MKKVVSNPIVKQVSLAVSPFIMLYALYVIFHGHYSPGGGFQGGTLLAVTIILLRLGVGFELSQKVFPTNLGAYLGAAGVAIYFLTGFTSVLFGGNFLDYDFLPLMTSKDMLHSWGILIVEIGVGVAVMGILVLIYDRLIGAIDDQ